MKNYFGLFRRLMDIKSVRRGSVRRKLRKRGRTLLLPLEFIQEFSNEETALYYSQMAQVNPHYAGYIPVPKDVVHEWLGSPRKRNYSKAGLGEKEIWYAADGR